MSPILIHDHMDHCSLLPLLVCNHLLQHWETLFPPPTTYLPDLVNSSIESELLTIPLREETYSTWGHYLCAVPFAFSLTGSMHFQSYLGEPLSSPILFRFFSYISTRIRFVWLYLHFILESSKHLQGCFFFLFNLHTVRFNFCCRVLWALTN